MQKIIGLELSATTSESHFTLDELVFKVRELFTQQGMPKSWRWCCIWWTSC